MLTAQRQGKILDEISKKRSVTVTELCEALDASESTIRRDLAALDREGKLKKVHGGAVALTAELISAEPDVGEKLKLNMTEKDAIAKYTYSSKRPYLHRRGNHHRKAYRLYRAKGRNLRYQRFSSRPPPCKARI